MSTHKYQVGDVLKSDAGPPSLGGTYRILRFGQTPGIYFGHHIDLNARSNSPYCMSENNLFDYGYTLIAGPTFEAQKALVIEGLEWKRVSDEQAAKYITRKDPTCECGAKALGVGKGRHGHSSWCGWAP